MRSMTGYGKGVVERNNRKITIEIKTVNHKLLDLGIKTPRGLMYCEDVIRDVIKDYIYRGHVDVFCTYINNNSSVNVHIDSAVAKEYISSIRELNAFGVSNVINGTDLLKLPNVVIEEAIEDDEVEVKSICREAAEIACKQLVDMRIKEGARMEVVLKKHFNILEDIVSKMKERAPLVSVDYAQKIKSRVTEALQGVELDENRFVNEIAFFVDKSNIDEELNRLYAHLESGKEIMELDEPIGKKLDFLVQEINREINTSGSKSNDLQLTQLVLAAKNELEKYREQVQNIE